MFTLKKETVALSLWVFERGRIGADFDRGFGEQNAVGRERLMERKTGQVDSLAMRLFEDFAVSHRCLCRKCKKLLHFAITLQSTT